jgi:vitamin B12 transporter
MPWQAIYISTYFHYFRRLIHSPCFQKNRKQKTLFRMSKKNLIITVAFLLAGGDLLAQQDSSQFRPLDQVVVTATRYPIKLSETGKVLKVITHEQVERSAGKDLSQLLTEQTGMVVNGAYSNPGKDKSTYLLGASNDYTLILLDGFPVTDPSGVGGAFDLRLLPLDQVDHIEILEGSQSTLYGSDAIAGVINIITRKTGDKKIGFHGGASYGTYNSFNANAGINGHTRLLDYNVGYSYASTDGISEATDTTGKANFDKDGFNRQTVQANLTFHAGQHLNVTPYYRYSYFKGDYDADAFTDGSNKFNYLLNNPGIMASAALPNGTLTANYSYTYAERNYIGGYGNFFFKGKFNTGDVYLSQKLSKHLKLLAGVNYQGYQLLDTTLPTKDPKTNIVSPYASLLVQSGSGLNVEVGGRYNVHSKFGSYFTYSINTSWLIREKVKLFVDLSTGFKAPTVTQLFGSFGANPDLKPEHSINLQGGVQVSALDRRLNLSATAFLRDVKDMISFANNMYMNVNEQKDHGFELEASYSPIERLSMKASYAYVTGNIYLKSNGKDTSYDHLLRKPKNTFTFNLGFQATRQFFASVSLLSLSSRKDLYFQSVSPYGQVPITLSSYTLLNAYAEYKFIHNKLTVFADAKNITNTKFTEVYGYNTIGFTITGGVRVTL